ncbi:uncharacterized protein LOC107040124 [Diachasma alloeum]|uniref:uncharacterized protein LOC107040124 n=1 Tax=Diachasma alloeum TaxID=454923 RepID=UPI00073821D5|nr:uncharacterized protein LOC107040124 [Diachasma alloeum]
MQRLLGMPPQQDNFAAPDPQNRDPLSLDGNGDGQENGEDPAVGIGPVIETLVQFLERQEQQHQQQLQRELLQTIMARRLRTAQEFLELLHTFLSAHQRRRNTRRGTNGGVARKFWRG